MNIINFSVVALAGCLTSLPSFAADRFSTLACRGAEVIGEAPAIAGTTRFAMPKKPLAGTQCETLLVFDNRQTALVRRVARDEGQMQIVVVSTLHDTIRPVTGRSQQGRVPTSSASYGEGGSRGGAGLAPLIERIELLRARSRGTSVVGVETFQVRFHLQRAFPSSGSSQVIDDYPLIEFDLCGRRVSLDAGIYARVAEQVAACENYTEQERTAFRRFWRF